MPSILVIGVDPDAVDYTDPALPPGLTADRVRAGLAAVHGQFAARGDRADQCMLALDGSGAATVAAQVQRRRLRLRRHRRGAAKTGTAISELFERCSTRCTGTRPRR